MIKYKIFMIIVCLTSLFGNLYCRQMNIPKESDTIPKYSEKTDTIKQVVITGQFRPQTIDKSIYDIKVIDSRQIRLKAANNLGELLKTEAGFKLDHDGVLGDFIRIRGLTGEHIKILIDGIPVTGRVLDRIDLGQLTLQNVDHIEIIEGPMSVIYGSNALAGALNIITHNDNSKRISASINSYYETVGAYNFNFDLGKSIKNHNISFNGARNYFSGWGPYDSSRFKIWKPKLQYMAGMGYQYSGNDTKITFNSDFLNEELRDLGPLTINELFEKAIDGYHFTSRWNNRLNITSNLSKAVTLNLQAGYSYYRKKKLTYENDLVNLHKSLKDDPKFHDTTLFHLASFRGFLSVTPGAKTEYQAGFDINHESADGKRTGGKRNITDASGFGIMIFKPLKNLSIQPGLRIIYNSKYKAPVIYALSIKYNPQPFTFKGTYAKGFNSPSLKQLYLEFFDATHQVSGNQNLKSETADNISFSFNYDIQKNSNMWGLRLSTFYNVIDNAIRLAINIDNPGWGKYFNIEGIKYKTKGAELGVYYRNAKGIYINSGLVTTGALRLDNTEKYTWSTDYNASFSWNIIKLGVQTGLSYKYSGDYLEFAGNYDENGNLINIEQQSTKGYHMLDLTVTKNLFNNKLILSTGLKNIFDVTRVNSIGKINFHASSNGYMPKGYGRTFFISAGYNFNK